jgi:hypothetical protein
MDWPGASDIAERVKKTLPPGMIEDQNQKVKDELLKVRKQKK